VISYAPRSDEPELGRPVDVPLSPGRPVKPGVSVGRFGLLLVGRRGRGPWSVVSVSASWCSAGVVDLAERKTKLRLRALLYSVSLSYTLGAPPRTYT